MLCFKIVAPVDARVFPVDGTSDEVILYSHQSELTDYEIVLTHVEPSDAVTSAKNGYFAGTVKCLGDLSITLLFIIL